MSKFEHSSIDIKLRRMDRVYRPPSAVDGSVIINAFKGWQHQGLKMFVDGIVYLTSAGVSVGVYDTTDPHGKTMTLVKEEFEIASPGSFANGVTEIPFEFLLNQTGLIETYHGVFISVIYTITVICERGLMKKPLCNKSEFYIETLYDREPEANPIVFSIIPEKLENVKSSELSSIPKFKISGQVFRSNCYINLPFDGEITIELSESQIKSIELQFVRIETLTLEGSSRCLREATEVQNIQIADGNVCRELSIPMHMIFPKRFCCATVLSSAFKIEFEINLMVIFNDGYMVTENFPVVLYRGR